MLFNTYWLLSYNIDYYTLLLWFDKTLRVAAIFGAISICYICIMAIWGVFMVNQTTSYKYEAIHNKNIEKYPKCCAKGKFNVCESASGEKEVVDEYWKIDEKTNN